MTYYLLFILDYKEHKEYVRQKANLSDFLKIQVQYGSQSSGDNFQLKQCIWSKNCCKGDESLEDKEHSAQPSKADDDQLRAIIKADPLKTTRGVAKNSVLTNVDILQLFGI